ncbi:hypothetical protein Pmar_PMAR000720 [Perkinsus marinus ATCC 50983]|uniref:Uncharacterized protein n=1 Tax=Perkinsus marinus (strain ATCC 50983 / TXsc) TaxID=423536 RepID=C5KXG3_PERM5|nr:hypothetical protein Pmar_PMAR000720 [Perkinsus marinus ATCC 50983]EER10687.1 hypothetical protein Pmar_PMAR000720 [Perkinsus marinus ATCC 50983]|eukprot:XP_002778892.1 hypothetical protein Pmar_PMAR000720 [Perkinsus marinus ATCC 50983]
MTKMVLMSNALVPTVTTTSSVLGRITLNVLTLGSSRSKLCPVLGLGTVRTQEGAVKKRSMRREFVVEGATTIMEIRRLRDIVSGHHHRRRDERRERRDRDDHKKLHRNHSHQRRRLRVGSDHEHGASGDRPRGHHGRRDRHGGRDGSGGHRERRRSRCSRGEQHRHHRRRQGSVEGSQRSPKGGKDMARGVAEHRQSSRRRRHRRRSESRYRDGASTESGGDAGRVGELNRRRDDLVEQLVELVKEITYVEKKSEHRLPPTVIHSTSTSASSVKLRATPTIPFPSEDGGPAHTPYTPPLPQSTATVAEKSWRERHWSQYTPGAQAEIAAIEAGYYGSIYGRPAPILDYSQRREEWKEEEDLSPRSLAARGNLWPSRRDYYKASDSVGQEVVDDVVHCDPEGSEQRRDVWYRRKWMEDACDDECYYTDHIDQCALEERVMAFEYDAIDVDAATLGDQQEVSSSVDVEYSLNDKRAVVPAGKGDEHNNMLAATEVVGGIAETICDDVLLGSGEGSMCERVIVEGGEGDGLVQPCCCSTAVVEDGGVDDRVITECRKDSDDFVTVSSFVDAEEPQLNIDVTCMSTSERLMRLFVLGDDYDNLPPPPPLMQSRGSR